MQPGIQVLDFPAACGAAAGDRLLRPEATRTLIERLIPLAEVVTPNVLRWKRSLPTFLAP